MRVTQILLLLFTAITLSGQSNLEQFNQRYKTLVKQSSVQGKVDYNAISKNELAEIHTFLQSIDRGPLSSKEKLILDVNAYNFLVIWKIMENYPVQSVMDIDNFFKEKMKFQNEHLSLDDLENRILEKAQNPLIHTVLNCGAISCPSLKYYDVSRDLEGYFKEALNEKNLITINKDENAISFSQIFFWYMDEFTQMGTWQDWLPKYYDQDLDPSYTVKYLEYNWQLNDISSDEYLIFYPTKLFKKGGFELKIFNNYYTQTDNGLRSNFFSSFIQLLIGTNKNFNIGLDLKYRSVNQGDVSMFNALKPSNQSYIFRNDQLTFSRFGISAFGPRIRYQPSKRNGNLNILHAIYFVPIDEAEGGLEYGYFDFQNVQIFNNVWLEKEFSVKKRLFLDFGFHIENLKLGVQRNEDHFMQLLLPVTAIYSYFPNPKTTFYGLGNYAQKVIFDFDVNQDTDVSLGAFGQIGAGAKYYVTDFLEVEALYTYFIDTTPGRIVHTFNIGLRFFK